MKKLFYSVLAASMLFATSCSHEEIVDITKGEGQKVTFKVNLPEQAASRAVGKGAHATELIFAMYEENTNEVLIADDTYDNERITKNDDGSFTVEVPMAKDIKYDLLFLAYNKDHCAFTVEENPEETNLRNLQFNTNLEGNEDEYDAFVGVLKANGIKDLKNIDLKRPFAQVNAATSDEDWENAELLNSAITNSEFTIQGVPSIYNVFEEKASGSMNVSFKPAAPLSEKLEGYQNYKYLTLAYVLAGDNTTQSTATANFIFYRKDNKQVSSLAIPNFPLERNHRTNVLGSLLTAVEEYTVTINPILEKDEHTPESDNVPSVKDVQTSEDWAEVAALLDQPSEEPISIKLGGINGRSADDKVIVANVPATIHEDNTVILDLNGYTLKHDTKCTASYSMITNNGKLTIIDSSSNQSGAISFTDEGQGDSSFGWGSYTIVNSGELIVEGGTIKMVCSLNTDTEVKHMYCAIQQGSDNATTIINGGTIWNDNYRSIRVNRGALTIEEGTFEGQIWMQPYVNGTSLTINGGSFEPKGPDASSVFVENDEYDVALSVTGGFFNTKIGCSDATKLEGSITGGTFIGFDPSSFVDSYYAVVNNNNVWTVEAREPVAKIGSTEYPTLQAAFDNVNDGETITLMKNIEIVSETVGYDDGTYVDGVRYIGDKSFTIDFNGCTVTDDGCVNDYLIYVNNKGSKANKITFKNGTIISKNGCWATICVNSSASTYATELNLVDVEITNSNDAEYSGNLAVKARDYATVNVGENTVIISNGASYGIAASASTSIVNINAGAKVIQSNSGTSGGNSVFAAVSGTGTVNINDGAEITSDCYGVHTMTTGTPVVNVKGGTITADVALKASTNGGAGQLAYIYVIGGIINGALNTYSDNGHIVVSGGTFSADPSNYLAEGYRIKEGTIYEVEITPAAKIDETEYASLQEAFNVGGEITLLRNVTLAETVVLAEGMTATLDLNGKTLSHIDETTSYAINNLGTLTIKGEGIVNARGIYNGYDANENYVTTAKLTIENGTFNAKGTDGGAAIFNYGTAEIKGGTFTSVGSYSLNNRAYATMTIEGAVVTGGIYQVGTLTIESGTIKTERGGYTHAIYHDGGLLTVNGGDFSGNGNEVINANSSEATINGGTFTKVEKTSYLLAGSKMIINGGTFNAHASNPAAHPVRSDVTVKGGIFNYKHTNIADGYEIVDNGNGTWTVQEKAQTEE